MYITTKIENVVCIFSKYTAALGFLKNDCKLRNYLKGIKDNEIKQKVHLYT